MLRPSTTIAGVLEFLILADCASHPDEWRGRIEYIG
jgi:hypothetical protein